MRHLHTLLDKAKTSKKHLWFLNFMMGKTIPFNKPHGFKVSTIDADAITTFTPYQKKNWNHLKGIHACAIATAGELAAGLVLMSHFSPHQYRFIMSNIQVQYHYQAKKGIYAKATITSETKQNILNRLKEELKLFQEVITEIHDTDNAHIATIKTQWQIKDWQHVQTKV